MHSPVCVFMLACHDRARAAASVVASSLCLLLHFAASRVARFESVLFCLAALRERKLGLFLMQLKASCAPNPATVNSAVVVALAEWLSKISKIKTTFPSEPWHKN